MSIRLTVMARLFAVSAFGFMLGACQQETESTRVPQAELPPSPATSAPAAAAMAEPNTDPETDPNSGLVIDTGWELVRGHCAACHSAKLVTQNRGSRETWESMIRWMQETQGLWQFDPATETAILDYLAKNYAPAASYRRAPLSPDLLPDTRNALP